MADTQATYVRFPVELHAAVKTYAAENDLSMAQAIRAACRRMLADPLGPVLTAVGSAEPENVRAAIQDAVEHVRRQPPESVDCKHPSGARQAKGAGLVNCGACGMTKGADGRWR